MSPISRPAVMLFFLGVGGASCKGPRQDAPPSTIPATDTLHEDAKNKEASKGGVTCSANRFLLPSVLGWPAQDVADDECRTRDLIPPVRGKARVAICTPGKAVADTLLPQARAKARVVEANGRDILIHADLESREGVVNGQVGLRFLSENGIDWIGIKAFDLATDDFQKVMDTVINANPVPRPRRPRGEVWKPNDDFSWDEYIAECWHVRDLLGGKDPALASVARFDQVSGAVAALFKTSGPSKR